MKEIAVRCTTCGKIDIYAPPPAGVAAPVVLSFFVGGAFALLLITGACLIVNGLL